MEKKNKNIVWMILFPILAILTVWLVISSSKDFSWPAFLRYVATMKPGWLVAAVLSMLMFIAAEGMSYRFICKRLGYKTRLDQCLTWSAADIFFSALTPSATGGQPATAILMMRSGIPGATCSVVLLLNLVMYTLVILIISPVAIAICPNVFNMFGPLSKILVGAGFAIQLVLSLFFVFLILRDKLIWRIADGALSLLEKVRIIRKKGKYRKILADKMPEYRACVELGSKDPKLILGAFGFNLLQRVSLLLVPVCIYLGTGGTLQGAPAAFGVQSCVVLGSNVAPLPGAMGVVDYLFLDGYSKLTPNTVSMALLSRGISFYGCFALCGLIILVSRIIIGVRNKEK